jgi:hypothetical protein
MQQKLITLDENSRIGQVEKTHFSSSGHKTYGNFPFVQKRYIIIKIINYYDYSN